MDPSRKDTKKSKSKEKLKPVKQSSRNAVGGAHDLSGVLTVLVLSAQGCVSV